MSGDFYEIDELKFLENFLKDKLSDLSKLIICDIGANIGNHTLYFSKKMKVKQIYSFEPVEETYSILMRNIEVNESDNVITYNCALGEKQGTGHVLVRDENNMGANSIVYDEGGHILIRALDDINIEDKVDFIKVDVEGFEKNVIKGGIEFLRKNRPIIYIEIFDENYEEVNQILAEIGYTQIKKMNMNYIYTM